MGKKELKSFTLSEEYFDLILDTYSQWTIKVSDIEKYSTGGNFKASIIYDGISKFIITQKLLYSLDDTKTIDSTWLQCICYRDPKQKQNILESISGGTAYRKMKNIICKYYSEEEYAERFQLFRSKYDPDLAQLHFNYDLNDDCIHKYNNCKKYDINGAYAKALTVIFPKAEKAIIKIYKERKTKPQNKKLINFYVGMLCVKGYRETFNWIVQNIRKQMETAINTVGGVILYVNTDGFLVNNPKQDLPVSKELGDFKLEYQGPAYTYGGPNYWIFQTDDEITGNMLYQARPYTDLRNGEVAIYDRVKDNNVYKATNLRIEKRGIK